MAANSSRKAKCPYCGAEFTVPATVSFTVCPYCGTAFYQSTGRELKEHYMYPARYTSGQAFQALVETVSRQFAAPKSLGSEAGLVEAYLHYIPLHLYHVRVRGECPGNPEAGLEDYHTALLALSNPPQWLPERYSFPVRGRRFFEPRLLKKGKYYQAELGPEELKEKASRRAVHRATREAMYECNSPRIVDETVWEGIVHYPFWEISYEYSGKTYRGVVDAASGEVLGAEYPLGALEKGKLGLLGGGAAAASAVIGAVLGSALGAPVAGALGGVAASLPMLVYSVSRASRSRQEYRGRRRGGGKE